MRAARSDELAGEGTGTRRKTRPVSEQEPMIATEITNFRTSPPIDAILPSNVPPAGNIAGP